jgi:hypothetical protein
MRKRAVVIMVLAALLLAACGKKAKKEKDFSFTYSYWYDPGQKTVFSTEQGLIQKDLVTAGVATADWSIPEEDLTELRRLTEEYDVPALAEELGKRTRTEGEFYAVFPELTYELSYVLDGEECRLTVRGSEMLSIAADPKLSKLVIFFEKFEAILTAQEVYVSMPAAVGAYQ